MARHGIVYELHVFIYVFYVLHAIQDSKKL